METNLQTLLLRIIIASPFGIGALVFAVIGFRRYVRFFSLDYQGNSKERFKDNLIGNLFMGFGAGCLIAAIFAFQEGALGWGLIPLSLCFGVFFIPIGVIGAYWRSYLTNKLWGGFMPIDREKYGSAQPEESAKNYQIDPTKIKIPRRATIAAFLIAMLVFFGLNLLLSRIEWNGSPLLGLLFKLFFSGFMALGIFMTIASAAYSRRIQKLRNGEPLDDDDDL